MNVQKKYIQIWTLQIYNATLRNFIYKGGIKISSIDNNSEKHKNKSNRRNNKSNTKLLHDIIKERDYLYQQLNKQQDRYDKLLEEREKDRYFYEQEITNYIKVKKDLQEKIDSFKEKSIKYDNIKNDIKDIRLKAEFVALNLIENGQCLAMDAVYVIDKINNNLLLLKNDLEYLQQDIKIGTVTIEDRLNSFCYTLSTYIEDLNNIKAKFYKDNDIPPVL